MEGDYPDAIKNVSWRKDESGNSAINETGLEECKSPYQRLATRRSWNEIFRCGKQQPDLYKVKYMGL